MFTYKAVVLNVVDGDTIDVRVDLGFRIFTTQRIRLSRIDTPERGQNGFAEARDFLIDLIEGKTITLRTHGVSKWGHFLGDVILDGQDINQLLLEKNLARPWVE